MNKINKILLCFRFLKDWKKWKFTIPTVHLDTIFRRVFSQKYLIEATSKYCINMQGILRSKDKSLTIAIPNSREKMKFSFLYFTLSCSLLSVPLFAQEQPLENTEISSLVPESSPPQDLSEITFSNPLKQKGEKEDVPNGYTINYRTISILEYLRFASKICKVNFIYDEADLNFTVTLVSDDPITAQNVMATLIQVLRIHGLTLLEQDNNLIIHKSTDVKQLAKLVTENGKEGDASIVTRIFRLKNTKPDSIAAVIRPMISTTAMLEVSSETKQLIVTDLTANVDKVAALVENLDSPFTQLEIKSFEAKFNTPDFLLELATQIMAPIAQGNPFILVPQPLANAIFIVSTPELVSKSLETLQNLDTPPKKEIEAARKLKGENMYIYKATNRSGDELLRALTQIGHNLQKAGLPDADLMQTIETGKWISDTNSLLFVGSKDSVAKVQEFLMALDVPSRDGFVGNASFFVYKPQYRTPQEIESAIQEMAHNLTGSKGGNPALIETIQSVKINAATQTLTFSGDEQTFAQVKDLLGKIDTTNGKSGLRNQFFIYKPKYLKGEQLVHSLKDITEHLKSDHFADSSLLNTLETMKWVKSTNSLLFTGDAASVQKIESLIGTIDIPNGSIPKAGSERNFFLYQPQYVSKEATEAYFKQLADNLSKRQDDDLVETIRSMKWMEPSKSFLFNGSENSLARIKELLKAFDTQETKLAQKPSYFIYKVQHTTGDVIEEELDQLAKNFGSTGLKETQIVHVIEKIRYVKETNSLLITGDPSAVEEVKKLVAEYDYPRAPSSRINSNFFMYKPQHLKPNQVEKSLKEVAENLKKADLADPALLHAIETAKYVEATHSLIFTGPADTLQKVQGLIKDIDTPPEKHAPIQHIGKTTFLLYKLKNASGPQISTSLKAIANDLKKSGNSDKDFLSALNTMRFVKETNSLLFTGNEESLTKVQNLVERFDVTGLGAPKLDASGGIHSNFFVYKPQALSGSDLEKLMQEFAENLKSSGLSDPDLFASIQSMRWVEKTQSLIFTGNQKSLDQIKELIKGFDVSSNLPNGPLSTGNEPSIQSIDNTSFLVYKLQFHKGDEIQGALRQIAKDLMISNAPINQNLLNSINSIQWLEVTNSLLCSGDQETLTRLRELIKNLDIPLKQVFIEILVLQTTLSNTLTFGLEWGGNYKYRNKFAGTINNATPNTSNPGATDTFFTNLSGLKPPSVPTPQLLPTPNGSTGFDLGIIGEVIRHGSDTYLTLGSFLNALQMDDETTIIMTPKLLTQDGRTSSIFIGQNIPYIGSFVQNSQQNTVQTSNVEYRDIGFNLTITPVLGNSDIVTLDINLDRSQTATDISSQTLNFNNASANGLVTEKTTMQTTVHVPDNNFLILSGMVNNSNVKNKSGIPCLGGLPLIGAAFSKDNTTLSNSNVVIFIRPHIINSIDDMRRITTDQEDYFRDQAGTPNLLHNYNEAMELIKTVDDE